MGQYYKPISVEKSQHVYSHDYNNGLKLMEHSWVGNDFVGVVENLIAEGGAWYGDRIVWAGDYADEEKDGETLYSKSGENSIKPQRVTKNYRYVVNLDTKEFVDKKKIPLSDVWYDEKGKGHPYTVHPLPLLTCEGNNSGGGDFRKEDPIIGSWARNRVSVSTRKPKGFKEIEFKLFEGEEPAVMKTKEDAKAKV